jgi:hypothetical protein
MPNRWVIIFESIYFVMKAEKLLKTESFAVQLIPVPRDLSSDCGMAIEVTVDRIEPVRDFLSHQQISCTIHDRNQNQNKGRS